MKSHSKLFSFWKTYIYNEKHWIYNGVLKKNKEGYLIAGDDNLACHEWNIQWYTIYLVMEVNVGDSVQLKEHWGPKYVTV